MSLTENDVCRLERAGHRDFCTIQADGTLRLRNEEGRCVFLRRGLCTVYGDRPDGCVLYPLVWFEEDAETGLHDFCPHRHEFLYSGEDRAWLKRSIAAEEAEIARRRAGCSASGVASSD